MASARVLHYYAAAALGRNPIMKHTNEPGHYMRGSNLADSSICLFSPIVPRLIVCFCTEHDICIDPRAYSHCYVRLVFGRFVRQQSKFWICDCDLLMIRINMEVCDNAQIISPIKSLAQCVSTHSERRRSTNMQDLKYIEESIECPQGHKKICAALSNVYVAARVVLVSYFP